MVVGGSTGRVVLHRNNRGHDDRGTFPSGDGVGGAAVRVTVEDPDECERQAAESGIPVLWPVPGGGVGTFRRPRRPRRALGRPGPDEPPHRGRDALPRPGPRNAWLPGSQLNAADVAFLPSAARSIQAHEPSWSSWRPARARAPSATLWKALPTEIRATPAAASSVTLGPPGIRRTFTGNSSSETRTIISEMSVMPGAYKTSAPASWKAWRRLMVSARSGRPRR